ncbi:MAG: hypothetical protein F2735_07955 [Actinobacteria bacterium]|uniref:Unannotated protein n=1 Tax=freshwater metagenome TaxID=449393 RepID=A0A6J6YPR6_9ZZZZ|nr:hypothetical protein [Actinomycetota bacterium]
MSEIDDVINESIRRRAGEVRFGGGSIADVRHRVVRRRRKALSIACTALAVPGLLAVGVVIGQRMASSNDRFSAAAAAGDTATADSTPSTGVEESTPSTVNVYPTPTTVVTTMCTAANAAGAAQIGLDWEVDPYVGTTMVPFTCLSGPFEADKLCAAFTEVTTATDIAAGCAITVVNGDLTVTTTSVIP